MSDGNPLGSTNPMSRQSTKLNCHVFPAHPTGEVERFDFLLVMLSVVELFMSGGSALPGHPSSRGWS